MPTSASAEPCRDRLAATGSSDLDGSYLTVAPHGSATRLESAWDSSFGGELGFARVRECSWLGAAGLTAGISGYGERDGGRVFATAFIGTRRWAPWAWPAIGLSLGFIVETDPVMAARPGYFGEIWAYAGITPYVRVGRIESTGGFVDIGLRVSLPAFRF